MNMDPDSWQAQLEMAKSLCGQGPFVLAPAKEAIQPLPGARDLLRQLSAAKLPYAIATSGQSAGARAALDKLGIGPEVPVIARREVQRAKPDPDLVLPVALLVAL